MPRKSTKDHSAKLTAVSAVLGQLNPDILKTSDGEALRNFTRLCNAGRSWPRLSSRGAKKNDEAPMIYLTRTDPARNMARFYTMALQPTLFGEWALLREWGRIGSAGRLVSSRFASEEEAALAMAEHLKAKLSKGYEAV